MDEAEQAEVERLKAEQARLEAEVGDLRDQMSAEHAAAERRKRHRIRRVVAVALVVTTSLMFTISATGVWARRNALNTDRWVETVTPIARDVEVQRALGRYITDQVMTAVDPKEFFESVLPERGQVLAVPLTNALRGFVQDKVTEFLATDNFSKLWVELNRRAHTRLVDVLEGDTRDVPGVQVQGDDVVLNVIPVLNAVLARIGEESPELFGHTVNLPTITVDEIPDEAIQRLEDALGRPLPENFGQFTIFDAARLHQVQDAVDVFNKLVVLAVILTVVLFALTLWITPRRRRTLIQLCFGIALGIVVIRRLALRSQDDVVNLAKPENREAVKVISGAFVSSLLDASAWILAIAAIVAVIAILTGPYPWTRKMRAGVVTGAGVVVASGRAAVTHEVDDPAAQWIAGHREVVQGAAIVVGILALLLFDLSWLAILLIGLLVVLVVVGAQRIADAVTGGEDEDGELPEAEAPEVPDVPAGAPPASPA
jgi:cell division protein FtsB